MELDPRAQKEFIYGFCREKLSKQSRPSFVQ